MKQEHLEQRQEIKKNIFDPIVFIGVGFGSGLSKVAPGTMGTIAACPLVYLMCIMPNIIYLAITIIFFIAGVGICKYICNKAKCHDHPSIVIDEFVGLMVACYGIVTEPEWIVLAFILFRFFDIVKPFPIKTIDRKVNNSLGIMLDDVIAGLFANIGIRLVQNSDLVLSTLRTALN